MRIKRLFLELDLNRKELAVVRRSVAQKDWPTACHALLDYYQSIQTVAWLRNPNNDLSIKSLELNSLRGLQSDAILRDTFTFQCATGHAKRRQNGWLDWNDTGDTQDREWTWFLNRHYHLIELLGAYFGTNDVTYVGCINQHLVDWILSSPSRELPRIWAQWRGLEVAYRMLHWPRIFYGLQQVDRFTPAARLLMLSSVLDHAYYLRFLHDWGDNWVFREMYGLANIALCWPEFKLSQQWLTYASDRLIHALQDQVYPDGAHKELTSHYHRVVLRDVQGFADLLQKADYPVPQPIEDALERMWNYLAYTVDPKGLSLLNNDSDQEDQQALITHGATLYGREDWRYIIDNGRSGVKPVGEASTIFPWAGHFIMRSGWDQQAHWAFFDIGPLGINYHTHQDKLHLSLTAYGRDLLVDSGRHSYVRNHFWPYFRESVSHNVILIDGQGQKTDLKQVSQPLQGNYTITPEFDFISGTCDQGFRHLSGQVAHHRAIVYLRNHYWIVIDRIETDRPRSLEVLWHFHPDCTLVVENTEVVSEDADVGNLRIVPTASLDWHLKIVRGQENPMQGWWSREYGHLCPSSTAIYKIDIPASTTFTWLLYPSLGRVPKIVVHQMETCEGEIQIQVKEPKRQIHEICVKMTNPQSVEIRNQDDFLEDYVDFKGNRATLIGDDGASCIGAGRQTLI